MNITLHGLQYLLCSLLAYRSKTHCYSSRYLWACTSWRHCAYSSVQLQRERSCMTGDNTACKCTHACKAGRRSNVYIVSGLERNTEEGHSIINVCLLRSLLDIRYNSNRVFSTPNRIVWTHLQSRNLVLLSFPLKDFSWNYYYFFLIPASSISFSRTYQGYDPFFASPFLDPATANTQTRGSKSHQVFKTQISPSKVKSYTLLAAKWTARVLVTAA